MGDKMDEDEPTRDGYKEALLSAAGKRDRPKAPTGLTPPAKAALGRKEDPAQQGEEQAEMRMEDLSMEEEILPQWSADEDDEALLKEASECGTTQHEELKERASASGAKRTLELTDTDPSDLPKEKKKEQGRGEDLPGVPHTEGPKPRTRQTPAASRGGGCYGAGFNHRMEHHRPQSDTSRGRGHGDKKLVQGGDERGGAREATPTILL